MEKLLCLADYGVVFATRAKGAEIADTMNDIIASLKDGDTLLIDFKRVEALSYSFTDELFSRLLGMSNQEQNIHRSIAVVGWSDELLSVLDQTLSKRKCSLAPSVNSRIQGTGERVLKRVA